MFSSPRVPGRGGRCRNAGARHGRSTPRHFRLLSPCVRSYRPGCECPGHADCARAAQRRHRASAGVAITLLGVVTRLAADSGAPPIRRSLRRASAPQSAAEPAVVDPADERPPRGRARAEGARDHLVERVSLEWKFSAEPLAARVAELTRRHSADTSRLSCREASHRSGSERCGRMSRLPAAVGAPLLAGSAP